MGAERPSQPHRRLRTEARSVWLDRLASDQRRAFAVLVDLIEAATRDLPGLDEWQNDDRFERRQNERRTSRVLLLGGGRGSGKTTVARTLETALSSRSVPRRRDDSPGRDEPSARNTLFDPDRELTNADEHLEITVERLRSKVVVLEPLSLADTPSETNILAALLARIEQQLFPNLTFEDSPSTSGSQRQHGAVLELLRLQTDVAIAWNGNLRERKGQLDPDNYAMEELRVERVRLQLRKRFGRVLRRTARDSLDHEDEPALFLLIVDDADVNPTKLMDLLERLRMVAVVEFVVLLVGDIGAIETAFRLDFANRFRLSAGSQIEPTEIGMNPKEMSSLTNSIGRSALRKHIPYHQRVLLQPLRARETIGLSPLFRRDGDPLRKMLDSVTVSYPAVPSTPWITTDERWQLHVLERSRTPEREDELRRLRTKAPRRLTLGEFIYPKIDPEFVPDPESITDPDSGECSWYVGSRVLADSPRVAIDLWDTLRDAVVSDSGVQDRWAEGGSTREPYVPVVLDPLVHNLFRQLAAERLDAKTDLWHPDYSPIDDTLREAIIRDGNLDALDLVSTHQVDYVSDTARKLPVGGSPPDRDDAGDAPETSAAERTPDTPDTTDPVDERDQVYWSRHNGLLFEVMGTPASRREIGPLVLVEDLWSLENRTAAEQAAAERRRGDLVWVVVQDDEARRTERTRIQEEAAAMKADALAPSPPKTQVDRSGIDDAHNKPGPQTSDDKPRTVTRPPRRLGTPWPIPMYRTTRQVEEFGFLWNDFLGAWEGLEGKTTAQLLDAWIALHTSCLMGPGPAPDASAGSRKTEDAEPAQASASTDVLAALETRVTKTKKLLRDLADYLVADDEWAATIACDWLASVGWLLERVGDSSLEVFLGVDFLSDHPVCSHRISEKIDQLQKQQRADTSDPST